jgi:hypothetical protein
MFSDKTWEVIDAITSTCPTCAFLRGFLAGAILGAAVAVACLM